MTGEIIFASVFLGIIGFLIYYAVFSRRSTRVYSSNS